MNGSGWIGLFLFIFALASSASAAENLTAHFIDVGQGDSILLQFNGKSILIDGGPAEMGSRLKEYLRSQNISHLDLLILTHPHDDHIGGLVAVLEDFPVKRPWTTAKNDSSLIYKRFRALMEKKNISYSLAYAGQEIDLDPALKIEVLWPPQGGVSGGENLSRNAAMKNPWESIVVRAISGDMNQNSLVLRISYGWISLLLMGDADTVVENSLVSSGFNLSSQILKVGHHGGTSASRSEFLEKVRPAVSVISVGEGNLYGYPTKRTLDALQAVGSRVYRTDTCGDIEIITDGRNYSLSSEKNCQLPA
jgi:beta-lactamase superfamily II metal-dependent hydrolase